jgi:serine/threonine protein kinase
LAKGAVNTTDRRACPSCGTLFPDNSESCPVCALRGALQSDAGLSSPKDAGADLRFEHYQVLRNEDGTPMELGHGAMGITYKAFDLHLQCPVALKIINAQLIGDSSARHRFVREARAAASVRHSNVASVFHLGETGGNYFYVMEFVDGETLQIFIRRAGKVETDVALGSVAQVAAGLAAIQKQHLVHRDIKPSNIMVSWEQGRLENVKIIDLGLAKGAAEEPAISTLGSFTGTPGYASPEQFAGIRTDIRSDLYSLGITLWEMLSGKLPFQGSPAELMYQHQHAALPTEKLKGVPAPIVTLLQILLAKDPEQRFQSPVELQKALPEVKGAIASGSRLSPSDLRLIADQEKERSPRPNSRKHAFRGALAAALVVVGLLVGWLFLSSRWKSNQQSVEVGSTKKSIAVLPFESLSSNKDDGYFADGVQGEILNNLAKIAQLKVISRTSVMQYRADAKRDLPQIANALGVANVLEGTVRREGNHVRVTTELIDASNDSTVWADNYDRDLTDIFAIQSEVSQTIARKLAATLSPEEKKRIEAKPTENLEAYDLYLQATKLITEAGVLILIGNTEKLLHDAIQLLDQSVHLDSNFALAYCAAANAHGMLYFFYDETLERRALGDIAIANALRLQPDLPEAHLAYAYHLYRAYRDDQRARVQLTIARQNMPNSVPAMDLEALLDRRAGYFEKAIQELKESSELDPRNPIPASILATTLSMARQFPAAERAYDRAIELAPDQPMLKVQKAVNFNFQRTGDAQALRSAIAALPPSMANNRSMVNLRLILALIDRNWQQATQLIQQMNGGRDQGDFAYAYFPVPVNCYSILIARLQGNHPGDDPSFVEAREQLNQMVNNSPAPTIARALSTLAVVDALLGKKEIAIAEAKRAVETVPISKDALDGPALLINLAVVYAWTGRTDLAFGTLAPLAKIPWGIFYGPLKLDPYWEPLRKDSRFDKILAELAPKD